MDAHLGQAPERPDGTPRGEAGSQRLSDMTELKEQALFVILTEHDVLIENRRHVGPFYVNCPVCPAESGYPCTPDGLSDIVRDGPIHEDRLRLRARTLPDLSDIHTDTRRRIRDLLEHDVYPEDLLNG